MEIKFGKQRHQISKLTAPVTDVGTRVLCLHRRSDLQPVASDTAVPSNNRAPVTAVLQVANKYHLPSELKRYSSRLTIPTANDQSLCLTHFHLFYHFPLFPYQLDKKPAIFLQRSINISISLTPSLSDPILSLPICHFLSSPQFITLTGSTALYLFPPPSHSFSLSGLLQDPVNPLLPLCNVLHQRFVLKKNVSRFLLAGKKSEAM